MDVSDTVVSRTGTCCQKPIFRAEGHISAHSRGAANVKEAREWGLRGLAMFHECIRSENATHGTCRICVLLAGMSYLSKKSADKNVSKVSGRRQASVHQLKNGYTQRGDSGMLLGSEKAGSADLCYNREEKTGCRYPATCCVDPSTPAVCAEQANPEMESRFVGARVWRAEWGVPADRDRVSIRGSEKFWKQVVLMIVPTPRMC